MAVSQSGSRGMGRAGPGHRRDPGVGRTLHQRHRVGRAGVRPVGGGRGQRAGGSGDGVARNHPPRGGHPVRALRRESDRDRGHPWLAVHAHHAGDVRPGGGRADLRPGGSPVHRRSGRSPGDPPGPRVLPGDVSPGCRGGGVPPRLVPVGAGRRAAHRIRALRSTPLRTPRTGRRGSRGPRRAGAPLPHPPGARPSLRPGRRPPRSAAVGQRGPELGRAGRDGRRGPPLRGRDRHRRSRVRCPGAGPGAPERIDERTRWRWGTSPGRWSSSRPSRYPSVCCSRRGS